MDVADLKRLRKCKKKAEEKNDLKDVGSICNALGELLSQYDRHEEAISEHEMEKRISEALQDRIGEAVACRKIGECHCKLGRFDKALKLQNQYLALAQQCNDKVETQRALATLGNTYYTQAETQGVESSRHLLDQAERKFLQALRVCEDLHGSSNLSESEYMAMKGRLLLNLGLVYDVRGAKKESTEYLQKALTIAKQWHLKEEEYLCHFNSANQALRRDQPVPARLSLQQALTIATQLHIKPRQKEVFCQLAIANVCVGDIKSAKHFLKKAYKILPTPEESAKIFKLFRAVNSVEDLNEKLSACSQDNSELFHIHEHLGDAFSDIGAHCGSYAQAVKHYQQMVECGERLGLGADMLIPAYVSLAQTYSDNRQFDKAISSYRKELHLRGEDHEQICRTWLNIAELEERRGDGYKALTQSYMTAFTHGKKANHPKLQVQVLRSLIATQAAFKERRHKEQTEAKLQQVMAKYGLPSREEEDEDDSQPLDSEPTSASDQEVDSGDLSISDLTDSDEENVHRVISQPVTSTRARRRKTFKKNEKGETPLHVACINGNLKRVQSLLEEGHPVNVRDHCGWTPLHEAANHDFPEIVEALLEAGADINDRGGLQCNGFTPLIDAAASGNLATLKVLLRRGANVLAKDDKGCTAMQALCKWRRDYGDDLPQESLAEYNAVLHLLQEKMPGGGKSRLSDACGTVSTMSSSQRADSGSGSLSPPRSTQRAPRSSTSHGSQHSTARSRFVGSLSSEDEEEQELYHNPQLHNRSSTQTATEAYRTSMLALGSSVQRAHVRATASKPLTPSSSQSRTPKSALIAAGEEVGDDWLIDDIQQPGRKRRDRSGGSLDGFLSSDSIRSTKGHKRARLSTKKTRRLLKHESEDSNDSFRSCDAGRELSPELRRRMPVVLASNSDDDGGPSQTAASGFDSYSEGEDFTALPVLLNRVRSAESSEKLSEDPVHVTGRDFNREEEESGRVVINGMVGHEGEGQVAGTQSSSSVDAVRQYALPVNSAPTHPSRVKVKIESSVFLIPIPAGGKTVGWLSEEACHRYSAHFGRKPFLTLSSSDGAILSMDDVLSAVLSHDEVLDGTVLGWDQPALGERYAQECKTLGTVKYKNINMILKEAEVSHQLCLSGLGLRCTVLLPITRALRGQTLLQQLHLPDNQLGDTGLEALTLALPSLQGLTHLNLAGNAITATGIKHLVGLFPISATSAEGETPLPMLGSLDLSHNPLGNGAADSLCRVIKGLPSLTSLSLSACHLTAAFFQHNRPTLTACLKGSRLHQLDVSHNNLGVLGVELLLRSVNSQKLNGLDLGHTCSDSSPGHLALHLKMFISQGCALRNLSLESCCLHQEDVEFLCRLPSELPGLQKLNISLNKMVTTDSLQRLLSASVNCTDSQLQHLEAESCSVTSPLSCITSSSSSSSFIESLRDKMASPHPLKHLAFMCRKLDKVDKEALSEVWTQRWIQASMQFCAHSVLLTLKQS